MASETDMNVLNAIMSKHQIEKDAISRIVQAFTRISAIDETKTFRYEPLEEFEKRVSQLNHLKEKATSHLGHLLTSMAHHFVPPWEFP